MSFRIEPHLHTNQVTINVDIYSIRIVAVANSEREVLAGAYIDRADMHRYLDISTPENPQSSEY